MQFCWFTPELPNNTDVVLVGSSEGRVKNLSRWPGNRTPHRFRAATAAASALLVAADPARRLWLSGVSWVSASILDTDSLLAAWTLLAPETALRHRELIMASAATGAFETYTSARAVQVDLTVRALEDPDRSPFARGLRGLDTDEMWDTLFRQALDLLPGLLLQPEEYAHLWLEHWDSIERSRRLVNSAQIILHELSNLSVAYVPEPMHWMSLFDAAAADCLLMVQPVVGGWLYDLRFRPSTWYVPDGRPDLTRLIEVLDAMEGPGPARWHTVAPDYVSLAGAFCGQRQGRVLRPSRLDPQLVSEIVTGFLAPERAREQSSI